MLRAICTSGIGMRPTHEDNFLLNGKTIDKETQQRMQTIKMIKYQSVCYKKVNFIAVSDGMGGHNAGEIASAFCVKKLGALEEKAQACTSLDEVVSLIQNEISHINISICEDGEKNPELHGMGATLVMLVNYETENVILNIGDSRAYVLEDMGIRQVSKDHTEGQRMLDLGILTRKELNSFPAKKNLNRYFGYSGRGYQLQADVFPLSDLTTRVLLCSDGISDVLNEANISEYIISSDDAWSVTERMVHEACGFANADNATAIIIEINRG